MTPAFLRSVLTMMKGTAIAQAIPVLISPLLARLYAPEDYGLFVLFMAVAAVLGTIATLRYELAIVVAGTEDEARQVARLALVLLAGSCIVISVTAAVWAAPLAAFAGRAGQTGWLHAFAPMVALLGCFQVAAYVATRARRFDRLARAAVVQQSVFALVALGLGVALRAPAGLIAARIGGLATGLPMLWQRGLASPGASRPLAEVAALHRQFALYNCPYSLVGTLGRELFVLAMTAASQVVAAGYYGLARSVVHAPVTLLSAALSQVVYREAASTLHTPAFEEMVLKLTRSIARFAAPAFAALPLLAPDAFALVFGERWREAGHYAALMAPVGFLFLFSSWPERVFEVARQQRVSFLIQLGFDMVTALLLITMIRAGFDPLVALAAVVAVACVYHLAYLLAAARVARLLLTRFRPILTEAAALGLAGAFAAWVLLAVVEDIRAVLTIFGAGLVAYYAWLIPSVRRDLSAAGGGP